MNIALKVQILKYSNFFFIVSSPPVNDRETGANRWRWGETERPVAMYGFLFNMSRRHGYLSSTLPACRAVARPHIKLEICIKSFSAK